MKSRDRLRVGIEVVILGDDCIVQIWSIIGIVCVETCCRIGASFRRAAKNDQFVLGGAPPSKHDRMARELDP